MMVASRRSSEKTEAPEDNTEEEARSAESGGGKRLVAQFVGHYGTRRILTKADQDHLVGTKVAKEDLVWEPGNSKLDVTDVHEDVVAYLRDIDDEFKVREVET